LVENIGVGSSGLGTDGADVAAPTAAWRQMILYTFSAA